jgi:hypothetical protein
MPDPERTKSPLRPHSCKVETSDQTLQMHSLLSWMQRSTESSTPTTVASTPDCSDSTQQQTPPSIYDLQDRYVTTGSLAIPEQTEDYDDDDVMLEERFGGRDLDREISPVCRTGLTVRTRSLPGSPSEVDNSWESRESYASYPIGRKLRSRRKSSTQGIVLKNRRRRRSSRASRDDDDNSLTTLSFSDDPPSPNNDSLPRTIPYRRMSSRRYSPARSLGESTTFRNFVWKLGHPRGLLWLMCVIGLVSISMTYMSTRNMAGRPGEIGRIQVLYAGNHHVPLRTSRLKGGGVSGNFLRGFPAPTSTSIAARKSVPEQGRKSAVTLNHAIVDSRKISEVGVDEHLAKNYALKKNDDHKHLEVHKSKHDEGKHHHSHDEHKHSGNMKDKHHIEHKSTDKNDDRKDPANPEIQHEKRHDSSATNTELENHNEPKNSLTSVAMPLVPLSIPKSDYEAQDWRLYRAPVHSPSNVTHHRMVFVDPSLAHAPLRHRKVVSYPSDYTDPTQLYSILDSGDERIKRMEPRDPYVQGECVPMQPWQTTYHPLCNGVHELGIDQILGEETGSDMRLFGTKGFWRNAWRADILNGHSHLHERDTIVIKTLKLQHNFEEAHFEHDRIDAVAMERLTSSPHVINVFGFCGHTVMTEFADGKRLGELADRAKKQPLERLKIARDIAEGLADVHGIDGDGNVSFVHLDINPANVVSIGGRLKLNDFNIGVPRRWNTTSNKPCGFPTQYPNAQWRSPEEARQEENLTEKVDIFSLGHIFFRMICGHEPWSSFEPGGKPSADELHEKVGRGVLPTIPTNVLESKDPEVVAIRNAMIQCYTFIPSERPSAKQIARNLQKALDKAELVQEARP